jgi:hypothetical protein
MYSIRKKLHLNHTKIKVVIRILKSKKNRQQNGHEKKDKGQTTIYKTLHIKLKIEQHDPTKNWG